MNLWIGTSGFQYPEWKGTFYPETLALSKMLPFYAERFQTTEVNYTFRRIPSAQTIERWTTETPSRFQFSLKAPQKVTHFAKLRDCSDTLRFFHQITSALGEKLGPVLFQLPPSFKKDTPLLSAFLEEVPTGMRAAFEFRHASWFDEDVFNALQNRNVALCIADSESLSAPVVATANFGYLRLRREDYTAADVERWTETIRALQGQWADAYVYFKHEESGVGPRLASLMIEAFACQPPPRSEVPAI